MDGLEVRLRELEFADLELLKEWRNSSEVRRRLRQYRLLNMENQIDWFKQMSRDPNAAMFGVEISNDGHGLYWRLVGVCGLCYIDWVGRTAEVSIIIGDEDFRHKGVGTKVLELLKNKAFDEYNLRKLWAEIYSNNYPSEQLFEKCGYEIEGIRQQHVFKEGHYWDSTFYALFREDRDED